ncbi:MAG: tRNA pseudouridine(38-40) synthase TruA [Planctomycetaceae bacterium]|nr:tRNA pseudouridine(38-40) synthase TruA [Planctomycetaceae bacterium]
MRDDQATRSTSSSTDSSIRNIRLTVAYEGTRYAGWQVQPNHPTIQGEIERAILKLTRQEVRVLSAGRTDSGVHAFGQVANFQIDFPIPPQKWRPALQTHLPEDIVILESDEVPLEFHSTFSAKCKRYRYVIYNNLVDDPFLRPFSWRISQPLDAKAMCEAAKCLIGKHDFRSFETDWPNKATSVRTVTHLTVQRCGLDAVWQRSPLSDEPDFSISSGQETGKPCLCLEIEADGFLYNMVRAITGTLVNVGRGTWTAGDVARILHAQDRTIAGGTAPAQGLFLVRVYYPEIPESP